MYVRLVLLGILCLLLPDLALADSYIGGSSHIWELPAFGNSYVISEMLNGTAMLAGDGTYRTILLTVSLVGLFVLIMTGINDAGKMFINAIGYILGLMFMLFVFGIGASGVSNRLLVNVAVYDVIDPSQRVVVNNVPGFIVWPQAFIYSIGHKVTGALEQNLGGADYVGLTKGSPFNLGSQLMRDLATVVITDPNLKLSLAEYTGNCVMPMIANGTLDLKTIMKAEDAFLAMKVDNEALSTPIYPGEVDGGGILQNVLSCKAAHQKLSTRLTAAYGPGELDKNLRTMSGMAATPLGAPLAAVANQSLLYTSGATGFTMSDAIRQSAMAKVIDKGLATGAVTTDSSAVMQNTQIELAHQSQLSAWDSGLAIFSKTMGYIFSVLQAFFFAAFPVLIITFLIPGMGKALLTNTLQIIIWMALWEPMLAVISFVTSAFLRQEVQGLLTSSGDPFLALNSIGTVSKRADTLVSAAGFLATSMPMLTWGLVKGSFAFTEFIAHGVGSQFANSAGTGMATGNLSMNNVSSDTRSANKNATSFGADGQMGSISSSMDLTPGARSGAGVQDNVKGVQGATAAQMSSALATAKGLQNTAQSQLAAAEKSQEQRGLALEHAINSSVSRFTQTSDGTSITEKWGTGEKGVESFAKTVQSSIAQGWQAAAQAQRGTDTAFAARAAMDAAYKSGGGGKKGAEAAGAVGAAMGVDASVLDQWKESKLKSDQSTDKEDFQRGWQQLRQHSKEGSESRETARKRDNSKGAKGDLTTSDGKKQNSVISASQEYGKSIALVTAATDSVTAANTALTSTLNSIANGGQDLGYAREQIAQQQAKLSTQTAALDSAYNQQKTNVGDEISEAGELKTKAKEATNFSLKGPGNYVPDVRNHSYEQIAGGYKAEALSNMLKNNPEREVEEKLDNGEKFADGVKNTIKRTDGEIAAAKTDLQTKMAGIALAGAAVPAVKELMDMAAHNPAAATKMAQTLMKRGPQAAAVGLAFYAGYQGGTLLNEQIDNYLQKNTDYSSLGDAIYTMTHKAELDALNQPITRPPKK